ncbi:GspL/Epsl periplasmic domain-containing protein [Desulforegula conservatrix]|uniref:GspL/Epsl periplasmic domain-containing protein n=1 Tax=Desulforegula conservatrix TaxID=153026 RepID=UPI000410B1C9|nr:GspL/Epsl periplasmic domain-containing protein [Desulforegula conservatrix]
MTSEYIGIEIGRQRIGLAVIEADRNHVEIIEDRFLDLADSFSIEILEQSLPDLLSDVKHVPRPVILSISPLMASFRLVELPFTSESKIRQVIDLEMETLVPFQTENMQSSFVRLFSGSGKDSSSVLACCIDGEFLDAVTDLFKKYGMEIVALTVSGYASAAAFACGVSDYFGVGFGINSAKSLVYADASPDSIIISIIKSGEVVFVRSVAIKKGGMPLPSFISEESFRTVTYYCDYHDSEFEVSDFVYSVSGMTDPVWLDASWTEMLEQAFSVRGLSCRKICSESPAYLNILSAVSIYSSGKGLLNFARSGFFKAGVLKSLRKSWSDTFIVACLTFFTSFFYLGVSEYSAFKTLNRLDAETKSIFMETFPDTRKIVDPYQQMSVKVKSLMQNQGADSDKGLILDILKEISLKIKTDIDITVTSVTILSDEIQLHGEATSFDLAETARKALSESKLFSDVKVDSVNSDSKTGKVVFKLNLKRGLQT